MIRKTPLIQSFFMAAAFFAITYKFITPYFLTNDDSAMMMIANGFGGSPSQYLIYINIYLGYVLKFLYQFNRNIPWYPIFELIMIFSSALVGIYYLVVNTNLTLAVKVFNLVVFIIAFTQFLFFFQFTLVSGLLLSSGFIVLLNARKHYQFLIAMCFMLLSSFYRIHEFYIIFFINAVSILLFGFVYNKKLNNKTHIIFLVAILLVSVFASHLNTNHYYSNDLKHNWYSYNFVKTSLSDYRLTERVSEKQKNEVLNSVGWTDNDLYMLYMWIYSDKNLYSYAKIEKAAKYLAKQAVFQLNSLGSVTKELFANRYFLVCISLYLLLLLFFCSDKRDFVFFTGFALFTIGLLVAVSLLVKPIPIRVTWPIYYNLIVMSLAYLIKLNRFHLNLNILRKKISPKFFNPAGWTTLYGILALLLIVNSYGVFEFWSYYNKRHAQYISFVKNLDKVKPGLVILHPYFATRFLRPFDNLKEFHNMKVLPLGWGYWSPAIRAWQKEFKVVDLFQSLLQPKTYLVVSYFSLPYIKQFYQEHYNLNVYAHEEYYGNYGIGIYRLYTSGNES